jgi:hypothetical protein
MTSRSMAVAVGLSLLSAGGAVACFAQASKLRNEAGWLMARGNAAAAEYASTFDGNHADRELVVFEQRRAVLEGAHKWQRAQMLLVLLSVILAFASYVLYLLARLRDQLADATGGMAHDHDSDSGKPAPKSGAVVPGI